MLFAHEQVGVPDRAGPGLPVLIGNDPLLAAVGKGDDQLGQQLRPCAVVRAGPLGVEADEPGVPPVGHHRPEHVLPDGDQ